MSESIITLLAILFGLIFFVVTMWRKAQETTQREVQERKLPNPANGRRPGAPTVRPPGAPSFEELIRQMQEQNRRAQNPMAPAIPAAPARPVALPSIPRETAPQPRTLEVAQPAARSLEEEGRFRPARTLEASAAQPRRAATLPRAAVTLGRDDFWSRQAAQQAPDTVTAQEVAARLRNPADVRTALILAEVLQRRY